jgi:hypothetical protein
MVQLNIQSMLLQAMARPCQLRYYHIIDRSV